MYNALSRETSVSTIIRRRAASLAALPPASEIVFTGLFGWSPVSTSVLTETLNVDRGNWATWRNRRITPAPLPAAWFRRTTGSPLVYRVDHVLGWLAHRAGKPFDPLNPWRDSLRTGFGTEPATDSETRRLAAMYARAAGLRIGDVIFTAGGFSSYLDSLSR